MGALYSHVDDACFTFLYRCHYIFGGVAHYVNWCVHRLVCLFVRIDVKPEPGGGAEAGFTEDQVCSICLGDEYHVIDMVSDDDAGVC